MARRKKNSPVEDFIAVVAIIPWWAGLALAFVSFVLLDQYATHEAVVGPARSANDVLASVGPMLLRAAATWLRWIIPSMCLVGAMVSAWKQSARQALVSKVLREENATEVINGMTWQQFELLVGQGFQRNGYAVVENGGGGADGGVDLYLNKDGGQYLVQCKQWRALKVSVTVVRELYGVMAARGSAGGFVVTSGGFTQDALAFAAGRNINLVDGPQLVQLIRHGRDWSHAEPVLETRRKAASEAVPRYKSGPSCPICQSRMVQRMATRGDNAGEFFWGCGTYPACKGVRGIRALDELG